MKNFIKSLIGRFSPDVFKPLPEGVLYATLQTVSREISGECPWDTGDHCYKGYDKYWYKKCRNMACPGYRHPLGLISYTSRSDIATSVDNRFDYNSFRFGTSNDFVPVGTLGAMVKFDFGLMGDLGGFGAGYFGALYFGDNSIPFPVIDIHIGDKWYIYCRADSGLMDAPIPDPANLGSYGPIVVLPGPCYKGNHDTTYTIELIDFWGYIQNFNDALLQICLATADGEWLDFWGAYFGVPRLFQTAGYEQDDVYKTRILKEVTRAKGTKPIILEEAQKFFKSDLVSIIEYHQTDNWDGPVTDPDDPAYGLMPYEFYVYPPTQKTPSAKFLRMGPNISIQGAYGCCYDSEAVYGHSGYSNIRELTGIGSGPFYPLGISVYTSITGDRILVQDFDLNYLERSWRTLKFDTIGTYEGSLGEFGYRGNGKFNFACEGTVYDKEIYISDFFNHRIQVLDIDGNFRRLWGSLGYTNQQFYNPHGVFVYGDEVYVADSGNDRIMVSDLSGTFARKWGVFGTGDGEFNNPINVFVYHDEVYVVDNGNTRIQVFNLDGVFQRKWGVSGTGDGEFISPAGMFIYGDEVYVADLVNDRIQVFDLSGTFQRKWGSHGSGAGEFYHPCGVLVYGDEVYVSDLGNQRIQVFNLAGTYQREWNGYGVGEEIGEAWLFSHKSRFSGLKMHFSKFAIGGSFIWEYWNGTWKTLTINDGTINFTDDGYINWKVPADWKATDDIPNSIPATGEQRFWVRARVSMIPTTRPVADYIGLLFVGETCRGAYTSDEDTYPDPDPAVHPHWDKNNCYIYSKDSFEKPSWESGFQEIVDRIKTAGTIAIINSK